MKKSCAGFLLPPVFSGFCVDYRLYTRKWRKRSEIEENREREGVLEVKNNNNNNKASTINQVIEFQLSKINMLLWLYRKFNPR